MLDGLKAVRVGAVDIPELLWSAGETMVLPQGLATMVESGQLLRAQSDRSSTDLRERRLYTPDAPVSSRLPVAYTWIPGPARRLVARTIGRVQRDRIDRWAAFPRWPLDLSADFLADLAGVREGRNPDGLPAPVMISHDIDTAEGLANLVRLFLPIEEAVGARSSNYIVPCGWPIDHGLLGESADRGHEVGVHGYDHSNRTPFCSESERLARVMAALPLIERYNVTGYRAPSLLRTKELLGDLARYYRYDSSVPTSGGLYPVPNNGCASARPFRLEGIWEIPLTLPRDGSMRFLGFSPEKILQYWISCAERIARSGGIVSLLTHCETGMSGNGPMLEIYRRFLEYVAADTRYRFTTAQEFSAGLGD